ncbi:MAG: hypothetical protein QM764_01965 [Chitinophagaceae bacterium]
MKFPASFLILSLVVLFACKKDKYTDEPQVSIKSISPSEVRQGTNGSYTVLSLDAKFTDQQGDIDSILFITKYYDGDVATYTDTTFRTPLAGLNLPKNTRQGDITVQFEYNTNNSQGQYLTFPGVTKDTTATLGLIMIDAAAHRSAFAESPKIRLIAP